MQCKGLPQALWYAQNTAQCSRSHMSKLGGEKTLGFLHCMKKSSYNTSSCMKCRSWVAPTTSNVAFPYIHLVQI